MVAKKKTPSKGKKPKIPMQENPPKDVTKPWRDKDGRLHLSKMDLLELEASRIKRDKLMSDSTALKLQADKDEMIYAARIRGLREQGHEKAAEHKRHAIEHQDLLMRIGRKYDVNFLYHHGYESDTGIIQLIHPVDSQKGDDENTGPQKEE